MSAASPRSLPAYRDPPAFETLMAFHFAPIKWGIPHFGLFWSELQGQYPHFEVHPPIGEFQISFESGKPDAAITLPVQCWFINVAKDRLIQIQNSAFLQSWRKASAEGRYLHYDELRPHFWQEWQRFCDFSAKQQLGTPNVLQCEVSYINHLERGKGWQKFSELNRVFPSIGELSGREFLGRPEAANLNLSFVMPTQDGRLTISIQPAVRQTDQKEIIQLTITGRCRPTSNETAALEHGLNICHDWVVRGFDDFTSREMHRIWEKL